MASPPVGVEKGVYAVDGNTEGICRRLVEGITLLGKTNETLMHKLQKNKIEILKLLIKIVEEIDPYTKGHSIKVYRYVIKIAKKMGLKRKEIVIIGRAALLHDIGKIAIDRKILNKKTDLTKREYDIIKMHPEIGVEIVKKVEDLSDLCAHILCHHLKYNGGGYPVLRFERDKIPAGARMIAVADSYDAMTSDRPYRKAYSKEYAIAELRRCSGEAYDPVIVKIFIDILNEKC